MAVLKAPCFSFAASGSLAKALVFFGWKGVNVVRSHVIPANPNTAAQSTQRGYMTAAVTAWHAAPYTAADKSAWNRLANLLARAMSGFNRMVREYVDEAILGSTWERMRDVETSAVDATSFVVSVSKIGGGNAPTLRWGTSPTNMPNNAAMTDVGGASWEHDITGLVASTLYYYTIDVGATGVDWSRVGIYTQRTTA